MSVIRSVVKQVTPGCVWLCVDGKVCKHVEVDSCLVMCGLCLLGKLSW